MIETMTTHQDLTEALATQLLDQALAAGATDAEVVLYEGDEFEALVRKGEVERLKDFSENIVESLNVGVVRKNPGELL